MSIQVFVDGQEGTTGLRIHEYLAARPELTLLRIDPALRKDAAARAALINQADIVFLCLPDGAAREAVALVAPANTRACIIDASTAFRTHSDWAYGLPELAPVQRERIRHSKRIAVPGCHATAFITLITPLVRAGVLDPGALLSAFSITGYSGGGKSMIAEFESDKDGHLLAPRAYALGLAHKHLPEMRAQCGLAHAPVFSPIVGPFYKGLALTVPLHRAQLRTPLTRQGLHDVLSAYYAGERFVRVAPLGDDGSAGTGRFDVQACNDSNRVELFVLGNDEQFALVAREDNLGKGASGAAMQCMNLVLGVDEGAGLRA